MMCLLVYPPVSDTDRVRVREHPAALLIRNPNPATSRCRVIEATVQHLGIYFRTQPTQASAGGMRPRGDRSRTWSGVQQTVDRFLTRRESVCGLVSSKVRRIPLGPSPTLTAETSIR